MDFSLSAALEHFTFWTWGVAITLLVMSVLSAAVAINRGLYFFRARKQSLGFAGAVAEDLEGHKIKAVLEACEMEEFKFSYLSAIVRSGLTDAQDSKAKGGGALDSLETVSSAMERTVAAEAKGLGKWLTVIATVGSTAPFVGLLGTVFGIINSFKGMEASESAGISAVAGGIAEALYMTAFGLLVAIPAVWIYNWATAQIEGFRIEMNNSASEMLDWIKKNKATI